MKRRALIVLLVLSLLVSSSGMVTLAATDGIVATVNDVTFTDIQSAVSAASGGIIQLEANVDSIVIDQETCIDLNGYDITNVTVSSGTLYVLDSATKSFGNEYGEIANYPANKVSPFCTPEGDGYGWLMFKDETTNAASFHFVVLQITDMTLQSKTEGEADYNPNLYYKCAFQGDEVVAENVKSFGVALSVVEAPNAYNLNTKCAYSVLTGFQAGEEGNTGRGTVLKGIMQETNTELANKRNANLPIYGRAYIQLNNDAYVFGGCRDRNLKFQVQEAHKRWTLLNTGTEADNQKKAELLELRQRYDSLMNSWDLPSLDTEYKDVVYDAYTWYKEFQNLPTADELVDENGAYDVNKARQLAVDFFRLQQSFNWTPNTTFAYHDTETQKPNWWSPEEFCDYTTLEPNVVYKGLPYCMTGAYHVIDGVDQVTEPSSTVGLSGSIYKAMNYYDPTTGVLDLAAIYDEGGAQGVYDVLTSNCTNGLVWGWNRVSNSITIYSTRHYTPANGAIPVGDYVWNEAEMSVVDGGEIKIIEGAVEAIIAAQEDASVFYDAYAQLQPGDGLVKDGHVRMCTGVRVVRDENNNVDADQSYVWYIDMNANGSTDKYVKEDGAYANYIYQQSNGINVRDLGGIGEHLDRQGLDDYPGTPISFAEQLSAKYIPVTIPEFTTAERIEEVRDQSRADFEAAGELDLWNTSYAPMYESLLAKKGIEAVNVTDTGNLMTKTVVTPTYFTASDGSGYGGTLQTNYTISHIRITLTDSEGNTLAEETPLMYTRNRTTSIKLKDKVVPVSDLLSAETLTQYAGQNNRISISICFATGKYVEVMNAKLNAA